MTETEWFDSNDAGAMLEYFWQRQGIQPCDIDLRFGGDMRRAESVQSAVSSQDRQLHRFYLASCRAIWKLLPQQESRRGVETAELYLVGKATAEELKKVHYYAEGAASSSSNAWVAPKVRRWRSSATRT